MSAHRTSLPVLLRVMISDLCPMVHDDVEGWIHPEDWLTRRGITIQSPVYPNDDWIGPVLYPMGTFAYRILRTSTGGDR